MLDCLKKEYNNRSVAMVYACSMSNKLDRKDENMRSLSEDYRESVNFE